jgi:hypothetical protein
VSGSRDGVAADSKMSEVNICHVRDRMDGNSGEKYEDKFLAYLHTADIHHSYYMLTIMKILVLKRHLWSFPGQLNSPA